MKSFEYKVRDENGIHARPAGIIVNAAKNYESDISFECKGKKVDCKRLFAVMSLGAEKDDIIVVSAEGGDEDEAIFQMEKAMNGAGL